MNWFLTILLITITDKICFFAKTEPTDYLSLLSTPFKEYGSHFPMNSEIFLINAFSTMLRTMLRDHDIWMHACRTHKETHRWKLVLNARWRIQTLNVHVTIILSNSSSTWVSHQWEMKNNRLPLTTTFTTFYLNSHELYIDHRQVLSVFFQLVVHWYHGFIIRCRENPKLTDSDCMKSFQLGR